MPDNHVFTCSGCSRQWTVVSDSPLECFFVGLCYHCIRDHKLAKDGIDQALTGLIKGHVDVTGEDENLFRDPNFRTDLNRLEAESPTEKVTTQVREIFEYWTVTCDHPGATLDSKRAGVISRQLIKYGRTLQQLKKAILGASQDSFLRGNGGPRYDDITLILRDATHIERYIDLADRTKADHQSLASAVEGAEQYSDILADIRKQRKK